MQLPSRPESGKPIPAQWGIMLLDYLRSITPKESASVRVQRGAGGTTFETKSDHALFTPFPWHRVSFGYRQIADQCTIYPGRIWAHSVGYWHMPSDQPQDVTLLAETCTVYAQAIRGNAAPGVPGNISILVSADPPPSNNTHIRVHLYTFDYLEDSERHALAHIHHFGDVHLDTPLF